MTGLRDYGCKGHALKGGFASLDSRPLSGEGAFRGSKENNPRVGLSSATRLGGNRLFKSPLL